MTSPSTFHGPTLTVHNTTLSDEMRYAAIAARDRSQDGAWYYAVRTTGVFCKPSCGARLANRGGLGETVRYAISATSLGAILVGATAKGVCSIQLGDDPQTLVRALESRFAGATLVGDDPAFADTVAKVVGFVESPRGALDLPLDIRGTTFQERVWAAIAGYRWGVERKSALLKREAAE